MSEPTIPRFTTGERVLHWVYFIAFTVLAVTGFILLLPWTAYSAGDAGETNRLLHRIFGIVLLVSPLAPILGSRRAFGRDLRRGFTWRREDGKSLRILLLRSYWTGDKTGLPPQGKFMAGQKLNIVVQTSLFFVLVVTGLVMWFGKGVLPQLLMQTMILLHALSAIGATVFVLVHIYMVTTLPFTRGAIGSMFTGRMSVDLARSHHPAWNDAEVAAPAEGPK